MPKSNQTVRLTRPASDMVDAFLEALTHPMRDDIVRIRQLIKDTLPGIDEAIKWSAPSFAHEGTFFATFHLRTEDALQLVFHTGAVRQGPKKRYTLSDDVAGLVKWLDDDRAMVTLERPVTPAVRKRFATLLREWVSQLPTKD